MIIEIIISVIIISFSIYIFYKSLKNKAFNKCDGSCCSNSCSHYTKECLDKVKH